MCVDKTHKIKFLFCEIELTFRNICQNLVHPNAIVFKIKSTLAIVLYYSFHQFTPLEINASMNC